MTTTAHEDQFTTAPEHVTHQPYDVVAILRQNVADLEKQLQQQRERHAAATARLRDQIERVTSECERADKAIAEAREDLQSFIESRDAWMARAEKADAELKEMREQEPVAKVTSTAEFGGGRHFNVQWLKPEAMKSGQTLYTRPIPAHAPAVCKAHETECSTCKNDISKCTGVFKPAPTVPEEDDFNGTTPHMIQCIESLVNMSDRGVLVPHGLCGHSRTLLLASANRLRQQAAPAVPEEWRNIVTEMVGWWDDQHMTLTQGKAIREKARALLQSATTGETK